MIKLDDKYFITVDSNNFKLCEIRIAGDDSKNPGGEREAIIGFYGTLDYCLKGYVNLSLRSELPENIEELILKLDTLKKTIEETFKNKVLCDKKKKVDSPIYSEDTGTPIKYED